MSIGARYGAAPRNDAGGERLGQGRRSLHSDPSITASPLRQRAETVKSLPRGKAGVTANLFAVPAERVCAEHDRQLGGESPLPSLMVAKG